MIDLLARPLGQHVIPVIHRGWPDSEGPTMGAEWVAIIALIALFVIGTVLPINMGALAYVVVHQ